MSEISEMSPVKRIKAWLNDEIDLSEEEVYTAVDSMSHVEALEWVGRCVAYLVLGNDNALK